MKNNEHKSVFIKIPFYTLCYFSNKQKQGRRNVNLFPSKFENHSISRLFPLATQFLSSIDIFDQIPFYIRMKRDRRLISM